MTPKETIFYIKTHARLSSDKFEDRRAVQSAIYALEKQIPQKPVGEWFSCPNCGISQNYMRANRWCSDCGQRLDWSEE